MDKQTERERRRLAILAAYELVLSWPIESDDDQDDDNFEVGADDDSSFAKLSVIRDVA